MGIPSRNIHIASSISVKFKYQERQMGLFQELVDMVQWSHKVWRYYGSILTNKERIDGGMDRG